MIDYKSLGIGRVIENLRRRKRKTQEELAEDSHLDRNTISDIERDLSIPSFEKILNIALALNVTPTELTIEIEKQTKILEYYHQRNQKE